MADLNFEPNTLYEMDNLPVLRGMNSETIDLIATDPPFNTKRNRAGSAGFYVDNWKWGDTGILPDQWAWNEVHPRWLDEVKDSNPALAQVIEATRVCHDDGTAAFLCFLSVRLLEMHRILKPAGSIYLHCDHTANAYIRMAMDAIFGKDNFRNEIVWRIGWVSGYKTQKVGWIRNHDTLLYYVKDKARLTFNKEYIPYPEGYVRRDGKPPKGKGIPIEDTWNCNAADTLNSINIMSFSKEKVGSPDQKPLALYERIIKASSNRGDIVLDPFAGCATTIIAARNLDRQWVGIDRRKDARFHVVCRMMGLTAKKAEELRDKRPHINDYLDRQMERYDAHYRMEAPVRTDEGENAPALPAVYTRIKPASMRRSEMVNILTEQWGVVCWGCGFEPLDIRYLELDHIFPGSEGGSNELPNRALLCNPCNRAKSNTRTLTALRRENKKDEHWHGNPPIDKRINLPSARTWAEQYVAGLPQQSRLVITP